MATDFAPGTNPHFTFEDQTKPLVFTNDTPSKKNPNFKLRWRTPEEIEAYKQKRQAAAQEQFEKKNWKLSKLKSMKKLPNMTKTKPTEQQENQL